MSALPAGLRDLDLVDTTVEVGGLSLRLLRPRDPEALLDEEAFAQADEYLPYWAELWPSALALAAAVGAAGPLRGRRVLEIGCGLGVPSLVAARAGADVLATDWAAEAPALLEVNARRNGAALAARRWSWTAEPAELGAPWPLVLAADVLYERRNGPQLLRALPRLVAPGGEAWLAEPGRSTAGRFLDAARADWVIDPLAEGVLRLRRAAESPA